ncbi:MAG TPA: acyl-CoA dehydrogenase family protein, partial [Blastocatellia bacterium]|nr:acyl-CoA dehydrogenase family protein [Blastocatellia bacterium]
EIGRGHKIAFNVLNIGRLKLGARSVGAMKIALAQSVGYAKERQQFGKPISNFGLIKQKIGEMAARIYVGESMLYRTAGMIDSALSEADKENPAEVLAVLEQYAIECSIIKAWESEALAYVVDEQVQIYGGYGYSKDYPAERAYRDARIARIYEGTNEINRIVIASQLLRRAKSNELPILEEAECILEGASPSSDTLHLNYANVVFTDEIKILSAAKRMALAMIGSVARKYGDRARDEQEMLGMIAEAAMEIYAMESAMLRTQKLLTERGGATAEVQADITRVFMREAAARIAAKAEVVAIETADTDKEDARFDVEQHRAPIKAIAARRRIADSIIEAGRYNL